MNELIKAMSTDMGIFPYKNESQVSFLYRVIYSGLGQWCLSIASSPETSVSKHAQSAAINRLIDKYIELFPQVANSFLDDSTRFSVFLRRVYEETGYLITDLSNKNNVANYGRTLNFGNKNLYFSTCDKCAIEGLGVFVSNEYQPSTWRDILIRDSLDWEEFLESQYALVNFDTRDIDCCELEFFNPRLSRTPSASWSNTMMTDKSVARKSSTGPFYRVLKYNNELLFCEDLLNVAGDELTAYEYRRLYFALKKYYNNPVRAQILLLDDEYSKITFDGHLPNREHYFMLLCSWPNMCFTNKREFIIKNDTVEHIKEVIINLGIKIIGG